MQGRFRKARIRARLEHRLALTILGLAASCTKSDAPQDAGRTDAPPPAAIEVRADREDLVFSFRTEDDRRFRTATRIEDIPDEARRTVVVTDLSLSPEERRAGRYIYLADLTAAREDGTYPVAVASRYGFETGTSSVAGHEGGTSKTVIVYSASWCGVCKKAKRLLGQWRVPYVEKDVEASRAAAQELAQKAAAHGFRPGGVPVIDVAGTLLQGLDERSLRGALEAKGFL